MEIDGQAKKFQQSSWEELMKEDAFKKTVLDIMDK
jgi:hypothetical protein